MKFGKLAKLIMPNKMVLIKYSIFQVLQFRLFQAQKIKSAPILMKFGTLTRLVRLNNILPIELFALEVTS